MRARQRDKGRLEKPGVDRLYDYLTPNTKAKSNLCSGAVKKGTITQYEKQQKALFPVPAHPRA